MELSHCPRGFHHIKDAGGYSVISHPRAELTISYELVQERLDPYLYIRFQRGGTWNLQKIGFDILAIHFGIRPFLVCHCGHLANKLYCPPSGNAFMCRKCWERRGIKLEYELKTINRKVTGAEFFYRFNRLNKIDLAVKSMELFARDVMPRVRA